MRSVRVHQLLAVDLYGYTSSSRLTIYLRQINLFVLICLNITALLLVLSVVLVVQQELEEATEIGPGAHYWIGETCKSRLKLTFFAVSSSVLLSAAVTFFS